MVYSEKFCTEQTKVNSAITTKIESLGTGYTLINSRTSPVRHIKKSRPEMGALAVISPYTTPQRLLVCLPCRLGVS